MKDKRPWYPQDNTEDEIIRANMALLNLEDKGTEMVEILIDWLKSCDLYETCRIKDRAAALLKSVGWEGDK